MKKEIEKFKNSTLFEGILSISAVWDAQKLGHNDRRIETLLIDRSAANQGNKNYLNLTARAKHMQTPVQIVDSEVISQLALGHTHGGFLAVCTQRSFSSLQKSNIRPSGFYIMLEGIEDPYNFGYALRSVYAAGADGVVLSPRNWMSAAGVVCRSSAGASELLETFIAAGEAAVEAFSACHYQIVCADKRGSVSVFDANLHKPLLLIVGGEKRGISKGLLQACSQCVQLEYGRNFPAALSTASAASILSFEVLRQNRISGLQQSHD